MTALATQLSNALVLFGQDNEVGIPGQEEEQYKVIKMADHIYDTFGNLMKICYQQYTPAETRRRAMQFVLDYCEALHPDFGAIDFKDVSYEEAGKLVTKNSKYWGAGLYILLMRGATSTTWMTTQQQLSS